jgi:hypothetical protein
MQAFSSNGIWWLPEAPDTGVHGTLRYSDDEGAELSLFGTLSVPGHGLGGKKIPLILGSVYESPFGRKVTLKDCWVKAANTSIGVPGTSRETYHVNRLFVGDHLGKPEDFFFDELEIVLSGLDAWSWGYTGFDDLQPFSEPHRYGWTVRWLSPEPISGPIPGGVLTLSAGSNASVGRRARSIAEKVTLGVSLNPACSDTDLEANYVYPLQNLMTLATDQPNAVVECRLRRPGSRNDIVALAARVFSDEHKASDLYPHKMIFSLEDVRDRVPDLVSRWLGVSARFKRSLPLYFGIQYKPDTFIDIKFLVVVQSLEAFQRERLAFRNESAPSQGGELLRQLLKEHAAIKPLFGDTGSVVAELVKYRDYVINRDSDLAESPTFGRDVYFMTQKLMFLMKACLLTELGFPVEQQAALFQRNQQYVYLLSPPPG